MECTLVKSELFGGDYIVTIRRQDGSEVRVMIPREDANNYENQRRVEIALPKEPPGKLVEPVVHMRAH